MPPKIHFSIITPTIGRHTLLKTCQTINQQTYPNWEHLVIFDGPEQDVKIFKHIQHPQRKIIFSGKNFGDYGHTIRLFSHDLIQYDHMMYIDDDDYYHLECLETIQKTIEPKIEFVFFPALFFGEIFMHIPPRYQHTVSCQYVHRKKDQLGNPICFPSGGHGTDSLWIEEMVKKYPSYQIINTQPLVYVDKSNNGQPIKPKPLFN